MCCTSFEKMSKHTPGPWYGRSRGLYKGAEWDIREKRLGMTISCGGKEADVARIVACVNALEGIDDPEAFVADAALARDPHRHHCLHSDDCHCCGCGAFFRDGMNNLSEDDPCPKCRAERLMVCVSSHCGCDYYG